MKIQLATQELRWFAVLDNKAKAESANGEAPRPAFELRRDSAPNLESKINAAIQKEIQAKRREPR
ncbi:MAG: hypothetical protein LBU32_02755 [Clostridiales bacterium]|jgi:hypothetical protein|nr:hypothetical protein [Clostridiales bacterium]